MKITEIVTPKPQGPMTPAQARIHALRNSVKTAQDTLKREREAQRRQRENERVRKALAARNAVKPA
jgi:hypothetical protein